MDNGVTNIKKGSESIRENNVAYADNTLFEVFTLPMIYGNKKTALKEPSSIVLTITISWWSYVIAALAPLLLALITVSYQSLKAAVVNPVNSLRGG